jgi:L-ornithine Nalpha-acyltransferase
VKPPIKVDMPLLEARQTPSLESINFSNFEVRLANTPVEIEAAEALRYRIFYEEMMATPNPQMKARRLDFDEFDPICDHLLVIDLEAKGAVPGVVGTYRLLRRANALQHGGFYTGQEYDLTPLLRYPGEIVELGRSCVDAAYRSRGVMQLLWRGLARYVIHHDIDVMFGCASFPGTTPDDLALSLSYLYHYHLAPSSLRPRAHAHHFVEMNRMPQADIDVASGLNALPPLIKGYLRVGGGVGDGAVIDRQFNTTDVCMIVETDTVTKKYDRHYRRPAPDQPLT